MLLPIGAILTVVQCNWHIIMIIIIKNGGVKKMRERERDRALKRGLQGERDYPKNAGIFFKNSFCGF